MNAAQSDLRIAVIQGNPLVGDLDGNLALIEKAVRSNADAELVVFPECFVTGYPLQDYVLRPGFLASVDRAMATLAERIRAISGPAILVGAPMAGTELPFNAAFLIRNDGSTSVAVKTELPNEDVFDERRVFSRGTDNKPLRLGDRKLGVMICEDMWHGGVARALADEGADILIVLNGSPMEIDKQPIRIGHARRRVRATGLPLIYANMTGGQDELVFDGGSFALDRRGHVVAQIPFEDRTLRLVAKTSEDGGLELEPEDPLTAKQAYPDRLEASYRTMVVSVRDYVAKNRFENVLLGVSGGVDSALVAAIAADAIGPERVVGLMLPSVFTGGESKELAEELFRRIGCKNGSVAIGKIAAALDAARDEVIEAGIFGRKPDPKGLALSGENSQPRARGSLMMDLTNAFPGTLQLTTGNKSENAVGYCTLYGDTAGCFNPIKDLYKTLVFDVCRWRNANRRDWMKGGDAPIPDAIVDRPPTAELRDEQTDEEALGAYPILDAVLDGLIERRLDPAEAARRAAAKLGRPVEASYAERIAKLIVSSEFKRRQTAPGVKLTPCSFGFGRRYPITGRLSL